MSTAKPTVSAVPSKAQPYPQRRSSSTRLQGMATKRSEVVGGSGGGAHWQDVTTTSPVSRSPSISSTSSSSIRPLPPPSLYQPPSVVTPPGSEPQPETPRPYSPSSLVTSGADEDGGATVKVKENTGRWLAEEHDVFLKGLSEHGKQWKKIAVMIKTRSVVQVRTHAQKYFQKLHKNEKKAEGHLGKASSISTSTATSTSTGAVKRKSLSKGNKTTAALSTAAGVTTTKKRRVSLEPKPKKQQFQQHHHQQPLMATAPPLPVAPTSIVTAASNAAAADNTMIDPSFMQGLHDEGELADSLLDLLDDSSVAAVEQVIETDDMDLEPNRVEPNPVSPSVSSMSLAEATSGAAVVLDEPKATDVMTNRQEMVSSPNPEDFSIHNTIGTGRELSPTGVACVMDIKDFEQKTSGYVDALDWLMDVGVHRLPATEGEEEWNSAAATTATVVSLPARPVPQMSVNKLAEVNSSALSVLEGDTF